MNLLDRIKARLKASRANAADLSPFHQWLGVGHDWRPADYGEYLPKSVPIYAAVRLRADALARVPWIVRRRTASGQTDILDRDHPLMDLLERPNPWYTGAELRRLTETHLCLFGAAFWTIEQPPSFPPGRGDGRGVRPELWPVRPDRMKVLPHPTQHIKGYLYQGTEREAAYLPEEVEFFRYVNPLQEHAGLSPIAPLRLSADMGHDALRYNRNTFRNGAMPDYVLLADEMLTDAQAEEFYRRWERRFQGPDRAHRPAIASSIRDIKALAFSQREMEFIEGLRWHVKDVSRTYGVPETMLAELQFATLSNMQVLEQWFWRNTIIPEAALLQDRINSSLLPKLGFPGFTVEFDFSNIEALAEAEDLRIKRETEFLDRGVVTINEVRAARNLDPVPWGDQPRFRPLLSPSAESFPNGKDGHSGATFDTNHQDTKPLKNPNNLEPSCLGGGRIEHEAP